MAGKRVAQTTEAQLKDERDAIAREDRDFYYGNQEPDERGGWY